MSGTQHFTLVTALHRSVADGSTACVLNQHVEIKPQILQDYCASLLRDVEHDLVVVCGAVVYADRKVRRKRSRGWRRNLAVTVPVCALDIWRQPVVVETLIEALGFVTGDDWSFEFVGGGAPVTTGQHTISFDDGPYVVMPFSDGMDSFLQWQLLSREEPNVVPLRIQTASRAIKQARIARIESVAAAARDRKLRVPVTAHYGGHPEPTYRTRTFLFFCMAALAAAKTGTRRVVVGENGVGALGPSLLPYSDECPHRTTHPSFTRRVAAFVNALLGTAIAFEHPQRFRTKGQVLKLAIQYGIKGWEETNSCVRDARAKLGEQACGVCSGCLLRRTALLEAGCEDDGFFWQELSASSLVACRPDHADGDRQDNNEDIMRFAAHGMAELASMARLPVTDRVFQNAAWDLAGGNGALCSELAGRVQGLVVDHAREWTALRERYDGARLFDIEAMNRS